MKARERISHGRGRAAMQALAAAAALAMSMPAVAQDASQMDLGQQAWTNGGCSGCHGTRGQGGPGGDLPVGPSLRTTELDRDGLLEVISCGRPGTQMPAWLEGAYTETPCYGQDAGPAPAGTVVVGAFSADEIEALVDYILTEFVQK